jgi:hypothetical protein
VAKVSLMNFGDASRVFFNAKRRQFQIGVGQIVDQELDDHTQKRIKRDKTVVLIPDGATIHQDSPQLNLVLSTLRDFDQRTYDELLSIVERVMGVGAMGVRPTRTEIRLELARRAALAAFHIQKGAMEEANSSLKGPVQRKVDQGPGPSVETLELEQTSLGLIIKGDEEEEESDDEETEDQQTEDQITGDEDAGPNPGVGENQEAGENNKPNEAGQGADLSSGGKRQKGRSQSDALTRAQRREIARAAGKED